MLQKFDDGKSEDPLLTLKVDKATTDDLNIDISCLCSFFLFGETVTT